MEFFKHFEAVFFGDISAMCRNVADFSYIPYSKQVEIHESGFAVVRKTVKGFDYGEVVIPKVI